MYLSSVEHVKPGSILGRSIHDEKRQLILAAGYELRSDVLQMLQRRGYNHVFIMDGVADDIVPQQMIGETLHRTTQITVADAFTKIQKLPELKKLAPDQIEKKLEDDRRFKNLVNVSHVRNTAKDLVEDILAHQARVFASIPIRSGATQEMEHAVDVTLLCILLGIHFEYPMDDLRSLATGALLHDLGKSVIPERNEEDWHKKQFSRFESKSLLRDHPTFSMLLIQGSDPSSFKEQLTIQQHHERLDGSGYPLRIRGADIPPVRQATGETKGIYRHAMVLSAANRYDTLVSGLADGKSYSPQEAMAIMIDEAGKFWNTHVIKAMGKIIQFYPVGCRVRVKRSERGEFDGMYGVVIGNNEQDSARPNIIITHSSFGKQVKPQQVNFRLDKRVQLELIL